MYVLGKVQEQLEWGKSEKVKEQELQAEINIFEWTEIVI